MKEKELEKVSQKIGYRFHNLELLATAFRHTSYVNERHHQNMEHNERLEFLGDAVLEILVSECLYHHYKTLSEGQLTRMRAQLVCEPSLAYLAKLYQFEQYLRLGRGEEANGGRERESILADCFEAVLGAIYLDGGLEPARQFIQVVLFSRHEQMIRHLSVDYKTLFQERVQQKGKILIQYRLLHAEGPAHNQVFTVGLYVNEQLVATGKGKSKKQAEMKAAQRGLELTDEKGTIRHALS